VIGNEIFGSGGLSSRLGDRVRQEEGLSYGIGSFLTAQALDERTTFGMYAISNPTNMAKVEQAIREELDLLLRDGITAEELAASQTGYLEGKKVERSDDGQLAVILGSTLEADRDMGYYAGQEQQVLSLTAGQVLAALRRHIDPEQVFLAVAGDFAKVRREEAAGK
jgi:zinc protease